MSTLKTYSGILSLIGKTPMISLTKIYKELPFNLFAKIEGLNPGGSIKDRAALSILEHAIKSKLINNNTTIIESSSGNMAIGMAQYCLYNNLRFICVVDAKTTKSNIKLLKTYKANIVFIKKPSDVTGEFLNARLKKVNELLKSIPNSYWPNQYENMNNARAQEQTTKEIMNQLNKRVDYIFCATSTCGTIRGCADYIQRNKLHTKVIAVDAVGSVIFGGRSAKRFIPGHGASIRSKLYRRGMASSVIKITDKECIVGCKRLLEKEAILAGGSSGAVIMAVEKYSRNITSGATCVVILPDRGERYLDTIYNNSWVNKHFSKHA